MNALLMHDLEILFFLEYPCFLGLLSLLNSISNLSNMDSYFQKKQKQVETSNF